MLVLWRFYRVPHLRRCVVALDRDVGRVVVHAHEDAPRLRNREVPHQWTRLPIDIVLSRADGIVSVIDSRLSVAIHLRPVGPDAAAPGTVEVVEDGMRQVLYEVRALHWPLLRRGGVVDIAQYLQPASRHIAARGGSRARLRGSRSGSRRRGLPPRRFWSVPTR